MIQPVFYFDFFGVIISEIAPIWLEKFFTPEKAAQVKAGIFNRADSGLITEEEAFCELGKITKVPPDQIQEEWAAMVHVNSDMVRFLYSLKQQYPVYLLTNAMSGHIRGILEEHHLYSLFDRVFISSEMKRIKPDPAFFEAVIETLHSDPSMTVMIDDNPKNIEGAKQAGLQGIVYRNNEQLFSAIKDFLHRMEEDVMNAR